MIHELRRRFDSNHRYFCIILCLSCGLAVAGGWFYLSPAASLAICFSGVLLIGLPHGGLDHRVGNELVRRWFGLDSLTIFLIGYVFISGMVVASWFLWPASTILIFFALSAWHFGLEEEDSLAATGLDRNVGALRQEPGTEGLASANATTAHAFPTFVLVAIRWLSMVSRGGLVIWISCLFHGPEVVTLLQAIVPVEQSSSVTWIVNGIGSAWPLWLALLIFPLISAAFGLSSRTVQSTWNWLEISRIASLAFLLAIVDPLFGFAVYFCVWHSVRGIRQLYLEFGETPVSFLKDLAPISLAAIPLFLIGFWGWSWQIGWFAGGVRTIFIGLSAVAIPHLLLHVMARLFVTSDGPMTLLSPGSRR